MDILKFFLHLISLSNTIAIVQLHAYGYTYIRLLIGVMELVKGWVNPHVSLVKD